MGSHSWGTNYDKQLLITSIPSTKVYSIFHTSVRQIFLFLFWIQIMLINYCLKSSRHRRPALVVVHSLRHFGSFLHGNHFETCCRKASSTSLCLATVCKKPVVNFPKNLFVNWLLCYVCTCKLFGECLWWMISVCSDLREGKWQAAQYCRCIPPSGLPPQCC